MTILKRPMFKLGGSAGEGITSGLASRKRFANGGVDWDEVVRGREQIKGLYGPPPKRGYSGWDALTEFGLNLASGTPRGNIISTAAHEAKEPFEKFTEGKGESEMADWMANMAATDKSLAAVTDLAVAEAEAKGKRLGMDRSEDRIMYEDSLKIMNEANKTAQGALTIAATEHGSWGISKARVEMRKQERRGHTDIRQIPVGVYKKDDETNLWDFNEELLDLDTIWFDINSYKYVTISQEGDKKVADYHDSAEDAREWQKKPQKKIKTLPAKPTDQKDEGEKGFFEKLSDKKTTQEEMDIYAEESWKKTKEAVKERIIAPKGDITKGDTRGYETNQNLKNIVQVEKKKAQKEKEYNEIYKWWKDNDPSLSYGYKGWPGVN